MTYVSKEEKKKQLLKQLEEKKQKEEERKRKKKELIFWSIGAVLINATIAGGLFVILYFTA